MKNYLFQKVLFVLFLLIPILAIGQERKNPNLNLSFYYKTGNTKINSLEYKNLNGNSEVIELVLASKFGQNLNSQLEIGLNFNQFSSNIASISEGSVINNSLEINYLQIPITIARYFNLSSGGERSLVEPYIKSGIVASKHLQSTSSSINFKDKVSSQGWDAYLKGGFGIALNMDSNWQANIGVEGIMSFRKDRDINKSLKPTMEGMYIFLGITYKF